MTAVSSISVLWYSNHWLRMEVHTQSMSSANQKPSLSFYLKQVIEMYISVSPYANELEGIGPEE